MGKNLYHLYIRQETDNQSIQGDQKLNSSKINDPIKKWTTELSRTFLKEEIQMAKMKNCSPSLAIKEMEIKTTLRFHQEHNQQVLVKIWGNRNPLTLLVGM
jgi:1,2-phenylacetyl-CoA epoxidase catalytic subunit